MPAPHPETILPDTVFGVSNQRVPNFSKRYFFFSPKKRFPLLKKSVEILSHATTKINTRWIKD